MAPIMRPLRWPTADAAVMSASTVLVAAAVIVLSADLGPQARHMGWHILAMNLAAPLVAAIVAARREIQDTRPLGLWISTVIQIAAVWVVHAPFIQTFAITVPAAQLAIHVALLAAAFWFWLQLLCLPDARRWHGLLALLLTAKLVCLLAALLVFAPRALYGTGHGHASLSSLDDQHLAGLLMIAACPLSYLTAGIVIAVRLVCRDHVADAARVRKPVHSVG
jgi:putative membrane protein